MGGVNGNDDGGSGGGLFWERLHPGSKYPGGYLNACPSGFYCKQFIWCWGAFACQ
jgi:hypothetical protein